MLTLELDKIRKRKRFAYRRTDRNASDEIKDGSKIGAKQTSAEKRRLLPSAVIVLILVAMALAAGQHGGTEAKQLA